VAFEVQQTRWDRLVRRVSGSIGPGSRVGETLSELFPVLDVERVPAELLILGGTNLCFGGASVSAPVLEQGFGQLVNPVDSNTIVTLTTFTFAANLFGTIRWGRTNTTLGAAIGTETFRDTRRVLTTNPLAQVRSGSQVGVVGGTCQARHANTGTFTFTDTNEVIVLGPGGIFEIGTDAVNAVISFSFYWRERPAEESELSLA